MKKRYVFLSDNEIMDKVFDIIYIRKVDGAIYCQSDEIKRFHKNPLVGIEADETWDSLVDRATNPNNKFYYQTE